MTRQGSLEPPSDQAPDNLPFPIESRPKRRSLARQQAYFLRQFRRCGRVAEAAARTGITPRTVQRWRANYPRFAARYDAIVEQRISMLEDDAILRATSVVRRPYVYRGNLVATVERYNDRLLIHTLNRLDNARRRAEDRAERRAERREAAERAEAFEVRLAQLVAEKLRNGT